MASLPPGFRFHPTDEELVAFYLKRKVMRRSIDVNIIREVDLYKHEPWDLPAKSILLGRDLEWYFFSPRDKKYPNGLRTNRATEEGYWKATGKDRNVKKSGRVVGMKKTLVFYSGRAPHGQRTDWVMHEYRLDEDECGDAAQDLFVLCRVFKKSGVGPRSGEDRGPNTYDDDDALPENSPVEKRPPGQLALELMKAMGPQLEPVERQAEETEDQKVKVPEFETPPAEEQKMAPVEQTESEELSRPATPLLSITDYTVGHDVGNVDFPLNMLDGYVLGDQPQDVEGGFWDSLPNITSEEELPGGNPLDVLESWTVLGGEQAGNLQSQQHQQQAGLAGDIGVGDFDTDDMLPPLVEEKESNSPDGKSSEARNVFRARSRPQRQPRDVAEMDLQRPFRMIDNLGGYDCSQPLRLYNPSFEQHSATSADRSDSSKTDPNTVATPWADAVEFAACDEQFDARCFDTSEQPLSFSGLYSDDLPPSHSAAGPSAEVGDDWGVDGFCDYFDVEDELRSLEGGENNGSSAGNGGGLVADGDAACPNAKADEWRRPPGASELQEGSKLSAALMKLVGSMPALPASAAECPPELKQRAVGASSSSRCTTINSIHVSAVTVTCTSDGAEGVYRQVLSGSWQTSLPGSTASTGVAQRRKIADAGKLACANCATGVARGGTLQRPVVRGSSSGFVFVFVLGAVSALIWFLTLRTAWRVGSHVLRSLV